MQIREKGKKILCIRTEYKPLKKRTVGITVASQDRYLSTVSDEVRRHLSKPEVEQLEKWLSERTEKQSVNSLKNSLTVIHYSVRRAAEALSVDGLSKDLTTGEADKIWLAMDELQKALKKAGFKRPGKPSAQAPAINCELPLTN